SGAPHQDDARANETYSEPAERGDFFSEDGVTQQGDDGVAGGGGRRDVAVIGAGKHQQVGDEKEQQRSDTQPDGAARKRPQKEPERSPRRPSVQAADMLHSGAEEHAPRRVERDRP